MVRGMPTIPALEEQLRSMLESTISVCHTHFDRIAIRRAFEKYNLDPPSTCWLDSSRVVRRTWQDLASRGYGLANLCKRIGYEFNHHNALEDAKAAGFVLLAAIRESGQNLEHWITRVNQPIVLGDGSPGTGIHRAGDPEGDLFGEVVVFTGVLELPRSEAATLAASVGCEVADSVTKKTTILVVGDMDVSKLAGHEKSSKHRKAEALAAEGHSIRIIRESDFMSLIRTANNGK